MSRTHSAFPRKGSKPKVSWRALPLFLPHLGKHVPLQNDSPLAASFSQWDHGFMLQFNLIILCVSVPRDSLPLSWCCRPRKGVRNRKVSICAALENGHFLQCTRDTETKVTTELTSFKKPTKTLGLEQLLLRTHSLRWLLSYWSRYINHNINEAYF